MDQISRALLTVGGENIAPTYVEDVFSTYLYTGSGGNQTITNGINLANNGGLVWVKSRWNASTSHMLCHQASVSALSSVTNVGYLSTDLTEARMTVGYGPYTFNTNGFGLYDDAGNGNANLAGRTYASWTFRKCPKFFDVVTYTGTGSLRTVAHNLGSVPGTIIVKCTSEARSWFVYHRSLGANKYLGLNTTDAAGTDAGSSGVWGGTAPTSVEFTVGATAQTNGGSGRTYVAYLFAHDAGGFGISGSDNVISCGSYTGNGSTTGPVVTLGYEPQWVMVKNTTTTGASWRMFDSMRGFTTDGVDNALAANSSAAETTYTAVAPTATGFRLTGITSDPNRNGDTYIYIAIRRGPMRTPTSGTSVFSPKGAITLDAGQAVTTGFVTDMAIAKFNGTQVWLISDRLRDGVLYPNTTNSEGALYGTAGPRPFGVQDGFTTSGISSSYFLWGFRRAPGFFDVVCYTGTGANRTVSHNLGAVPEMMIVKTRGTADDWYVYSQSLTLSELLVLNTTQAKQSSALWNTAPTASVFGLSNAGNVNASGFTYVAYLFATVAGVSKVGSYTGNGTTLQVNCGFTGGSRFVLIKRTDSVGDWYVWDTARGIVSTNDPHLSLNSTAAEVTTNDSVDPDNTGFIVNQLSATNINVTSATYLYLAIA